MKKKTKKRTNNVRSSSAKKGPWKKARSGSRDWKYRVSLCSMDGEAVGTLLEASAWNADLKTFEVRAYATYSFDTEKKKTFRTPDHGDAEFTEEIRVREYKNALLWLA